ncbi:hypothetical protein ACFFX1_45875 [Dactylosporangium sucinum]|uniref:Uncharacterized protein n=1 Tax=Dactylosporangium sucinum TaxID=1424081 RepID=A0A917TP52_9ACTN|nr:hypothetical protein [Dactylosporangium sucinum]GGM31482.1 hypothetical protein GCM10007977_035930 [Dactylosporangium sucinum]
MGDGGVYSTGDGIATGVLDAIIIAAGGWLAITAEPSGAGALAMAYVTPVAIMNIRAWAPFQEADNAWTSLSGSFAEMAREIDVLNGELDPFWKGAGSEAFKSFINTKVITPLGSLQELCERASDGCNGVADSLETVFYTWLGTTVAAALACLAADLTGPVSPAAKWAIIGAWITFVTGCLVAIIMLMQGMRAASSAMGTAMEELKRGFKIEGDKVSKESSRIGDDQRDLILNPENWNKEVQA